MSQNDKNLLDSKQALAAFFEDLVQEPQTPPARDSTPDQAGLQLVHPSAEMRQAHTPASTSAPTLDKPDLSLYERMPTVEEEEAEAPPPAPTVEEPVPEAEPPVAESVPVEEQAVPAPEEQAPLGKPAWSEAPFQAMLFKVGGLTLAVPLVDLNGVVEWDAEAVTQMPGHSDFYLGLIKHIDHNVPVVDTARLVLPPEKLSALAGDDPYQRIQRVVLISDSAYGLGCDEVNEVVTLSPEEVRWRSARTSRPWLAGTVIEHMCALIDASAFARMLAERRNVQEFHA